MEPAKVVIKDIEGNPSYPLDISGHTPSMPSGAVADILTEQGADTLEDYFLHPAVRSVFLEAIYKVIPGWLSWVPGKKKLIQKIYNTAINSGVKALRDAY